jgi:hypothetical protein
MEGGDNNKTRSSVDSLPNGSIRIKQAGTKRISLLFSSKDDSQTAHERGLAEVVSFYLSI